MSMSPLRQPLHIFRKDAIHLWPEILVSIGLLAAFAWADVQSWAPSDGGFNAAGFGAGLLRFLIPVSWLVLISRTVHDEELVGDRQFWITRPYTWYSLLAAKVLFLAAFVALPFLIMQVCVLKYAGLYPTLAVEGLVHNQLFVALVFLLPLLAIAAVTATFIRFASSVLVGLIYVFVVVLFAVFRWESNLDSPYVTVGIAIVAVLFFLAATLLQYARRNSLIARLLLLALPLVFLLIAIAAPAGLLTGLKYPDKTTGTLSYNAGPLLGEPQGRLFVFQKKVLISLPVNVKLDGLPEHAFIAAQRVHFVLDGPCGLHYDSGWEATREFYSPQSPFGHVPLALPQSIFDRLHNQPVKLHVDLGVQLFKPGTPYSVDATEKPFPVPGHAQCQVNVESGEVECRYPFGNPDPTQVLGTVHSGDCLTPGPQTAEAIAELPPTQVPVGFNPVEQASFQLGVRTQKVSVCPGTRLTFTTQLASDLSRMKLDVPSASIDQYAVRIPVGEAVR